MVAPRILWRYIARDVLLYTTLGLTVFTLLLVVQNTLRFMDELVVAGIRPGAILRLVAAILPSYLPYAIPTSLLMGVLLAFGRMSSDAEIVAMRASGVSVVRLLPPVLLLGSLAALATGYLLFELEPRSHLQLKRLVREMLSSVKVAEPGQFRALGERIVYVHESGDASCPLGGVLIGDFSNPRRTLYIAARCGSILAGADRASLGLELSDGSIHFSESDSGRYRKIRFAQMRTEVDLSGYLNRNPRARDLSFRGLLKARRQLRAGEEHGVRGRNVRLELEVQLHRRLAFPFASVLLTFLAVPLGIRPVRTGRSAGALTAIGLMTAYWLLFSAGEMASLNGWLPVWLGIWLANVLIACLGFGLLRWTSRSDS